MSPFIKKIRDSVSGVKPKDLIYPGIVFLFAIIVGIIFILSILILTFTIILFNLIVGDFLICSSHWIRWPL